MCVYVHEVKDGMIFQREAKLNRTYHLSPNENIFTITLMKNIPYLFYITSEIYF